MPNTRTELQGNHLFGISLILKLSAAVLLVWGMSLATCQQLHAQGQDYGYGSVIGGSDESRYGGRSFLRDNEEGMRITLIRSTPPGRIGSGRMLGGGGSGTDGVQFGGGGSGGGGSSSAPSGNVDIYEVPTDTDYLELLVFYAGLDPRRIRQSQIRILRVDSTGAPPFYSEEIHRSWTSHNFREEYRQGGPFETLEPGDIVIVEGRGILNRPFFDPIADINFLITVPTLVLSFVSIYRLFQ